MSNVLVARALSSDMNWRIMSLLMAGERSEQEIIGFLGAKRSTVKLHLMELAKVGIVIRDRKNSHEGKATSFFRLTGDSKFIGFPPRNYLLISEALINGIRSTLGEEGARAVLRDVGLRVGEDVARALNARVGSAKWNPRAFAEHFVKGFLAEMQTYPRLVKVERNEVIYEQRNCLFQELAIKYPGLVCNVLDEAVHEGMDKKLGGAKTTVIKCRGHGDPVCRFSTIWPTSSQKQSAPPATRLAE